MPKVITEYAFDLHSGLDRTQVPEFESLPLVGMAATLAIHIKGLGEIDYEVLKRVCDHFMAIPPYALKSVVEMLEDVEFLRILQDGKSITKIIPNIPIFESVYSGFDEYINNQLHLNEHETAIVEILSALQKSPQNKDSLNHSSGLEKRVFDSCLSLGNRSGILTEKKARGRTIIISPHYFTDNLQGLADAAVSAGVGSLEKALTVIRQNQGWPLSLLIARGEIGGTKLESMEKDLVTKLAVEGMIKPPTVKFGKQQESFLFTPRPGSLRLNAANREIYERAMALVAAVRKGQLLADQYKIRSPLSILRALRDRGYLGANSEAAAQYQNLVTHRVAYLKPTSSGMWQLHLNKTPENERALQLAIELLNTGAMASLDVNQEARIALTKDEEYVNSLVAAAELRKRPEAPRNPDAEAAFDQLLLGL